MSKQNNKKNKKNNQKQDELAQTEKETGQNNKIQQQNEENQNNENHQQLQQQQQQKQQPQLLQQDQGQEEEKKLEFQAQNNNINQQIQKQNKKNQNEQDDNNDEGDEQEEEIKYNKLSKEQIKIIKMAPKLTILVGLPGSGKSTFCQLLQTINLQDKPNTHYAVASSDLDKAEGLEQKLKQFATKKQQFNLIVDRTNLKAEDRKKFIEMAQQNPKNIMCIVFDTSPNECVNRIEKRLDHPTFNSQKFTRKQLETTMQNAHAMLKQQFPDEFQQKIIIKNEEDLLNTLIKVYGADLEIVKNRLTVFTGRWYFFKFPRTRHLWNTGSATDDDVQSTQAQQTLFFGPKAKEVLIQEKVDGTNLGISINDEDVIVYQNRGKLINSESESQFKKLTKFQDQYGYAFYEMLEKRYILFGEWCTQKHSIFYDKLPLPFLVFDIYDKYAQKFLSYEKVKEKVEPYELHVVPMIGRRIINNKQELEELLELNSQFREGKLEGIYMRIEEGDYCVDRCKLVRPDFVQGIDVHWKKMDKVENKFLNF